MKKTALLIIVLILFPFVCKADAVDYDASFEKFRLAAWIINAEDFYDVSENRGLLEGADKTLVKKLKKTIKKAKKSRDVDTANEMTKTFQDIFEKFGVSIETITIIENQIKVNWLLLKSTAKEDEMGLFGKKDHSPEWINLNNDQKERYVVSAIKIYFENDLSVANNKQYTEQEINDLISGFKEQGIVNQIIDGITKGYLEKGGINKPVHKIVPEFIKNFFEKLNELLQEKEDGMGFFKNAMGQADRVNDYFCNAIRVSIFLGDGNARGAALVAAIVADKKQRKSMVDYIVGMAPDLRSFPADGKDEKAAIENSIENLLILKTEIERKNWGIKDIIAAKNSLANTAPDLAIALDPPVNPNIFIEKYPEVFKDRE